MQNFTGNIAQVVKYINDDIKGIQKTVDNIVYIIEYLTTSKISKSIIKKSVDNLITIVEGICDVAKILDKKHSFIIGLATRSTELLSNTDVMVNNLISCATILHQLKSSIKLNKNDKKALNKSIDAIFSAYIEILIGAARISYFLRTGKSHWWQIFGKVDPRNILWSLVQTMSLTLAYNKLFKTLDPVTSQLILIGQKDVHVKRGLKMLFRIFFGKRKTLGAFGDSYNGLLTMFNNITIEDLVYASIAMAKASVILIAYNKLIEEYLNPIIQQLILMGGQRDTIKNGINVINGVLFGFGSIRERMSLNTVPGLLSLFNTISLQDIISVSYKSFMILPFLYMMHEYVLYLMQGIVDELVNIGSDSVAIKRGIKTVMLIIHGKKGFVGFGKVPSLFTVVNDLSDSGDISKLAKVTLIVLMLAVITSAIHLLVSQLSAIGNHMGLFGKRRIKKAIKFIDIQIPKLIESLLKISSMLSTSDAIKIIVTVLLLNIIIIGFTTLGTMLAILGFESLAIAAGVLAINLLVVGIKFICKLINSMDIQDITSASAKVMLLFPMLIGEMGLAAIITLIKKAGFTFQDMIGLGVFIAMSYMLVAGILLMSIAINIVGERAIKGTSLIKTMLVSLFAAVSGKTIINILEDIKAADFSVQSLIKIVMFVAAASVLILSISTVAAIISLLPLSTILQGIAAMTAIAADSVLVAKTISAINEEISNGLEVKNFISLAISTALLVGLFSLVGLAGPLLLAAIPGMVLLGIAMLTLSFIILELYIISQLNLDFLEKAKENAKFIIKSVFEIVYELATPINVFDEEDQGLGSMAINMITSLGFNIGALANLIVVVPTLLLTVLALGLLLMITGMLYLISMIKIDPVVIIEATRNIISTVFEVINELINYHFNFSDLFGQEDGVITGIIGSICNFFGVDEIAVGFGVDTIMAILQLAMKVILLALAAIAVGLILLMAYMLKSIPNTVEEVMKSKDKILQGINGVIGIIGDIFTAFRESDFKFDKAEESDGMLTKLARAVLPSSIMDLASMIGFIGKIGLALIMLGLVAATAETADFTANILNKYSKAPTDMKTKMTNLLNSVKDAAKAINGLEKDDNLNDLVDKAGKYESIVNQSDKLINKVNKIDLAKMQAMASMFAQAAAFSKSINGNFDKLAEAISEKLAPILEELKNAIENADKTIRERSQQTQQTQQIQQMFTPTTLQPIPQVQQPVPQPVPQVQQIKTTQQSKNKLSLDQYFKENGYVPIKTI